MVQNPEQFLVLELQASVEGKPLPTQVYTTFLFLGVRSHERERECVMCTAPDLVAGLTSGGSGNWGPLGWAVAYRQNPAGIRERWLAFFDASRKVWMGDELLSTTYGLWGHCLPVAAVHGMAVACGDASLSAAALDWLRFFFAIYELCRAPDGTILTVGMRSSPWHAPEQAATWLGWVRALARGENLAPWEAAGKKWGLGMGQSFIPPTARAVLPSLAAAAKSTEALPDFGMMTPLHILRADTGLAVWLEANVNANTPPLMAACWRGAGLVGFAPDAGSGGKLARIRQQFDQATCRREGDSLVYESSLYGRMVLPLPAGGTERVIGGPDGAASLPPPSPVPPPAAPPPGGTLDPHLAEDFASRLSALRLGKADSAARTRVLAELLACPPLEELAGVADRVAALGIGPSQPQKKDQDQLVADMRAAAGA